MAEPIYATSADLATYTGVAAPANATVLLREASGLVAYAIRGAVYDVDGADLPTDADLLAACVRATCIQAAAWSVNGVDPLAGRSATAQRVTAKSAAGVSVTYAQDERDAKAMSDLASGEVLMPAALRVLWSAGLLTTQVQARGW